MAEPQRRQSREPEALERLRRIETRITAMGIALGVEMGAQKPIFSLDNGQATIRLPSINSSLKEILASVPPNWVSTDPIDLYIGSDLVGSVLVKR